MFATQAEKPYERIVFYLTVAILLPYLLLRAWYVAPMHDELATLFHYIETGRIFQKHMIHDANNHLLNSWIGNAIFHLGLKEFFWYRLANVLAFVPYLFAIRRLIANYHRPSTRIFTLLACATPAFLLDYFAYSRGYGLGLGFFAWVLVFAQQWLKHKQTKDALWLLFFTFMSMFSNLIFTGSVMLVLALLFWVLVFRKKETDQKTKIKVIGAAFLFMVAISPMIYYSMFLRKIGALYYGSLDGFWAVSGKTLTRLVLYYDADWLAWPLGLLLVIITAKAIRKWMNSGKKVLDDGELTVAYFLIGNVFIIYFLALVMQVNYPEDRAGIYFIPLFLMATAALLDQHQIGKYFLGIYFFFPMSLILKANIHTSIFSPEMRMPQSWYQSVRKKLKADELVSLYPTMQLCWHYAERHQQKVMLPQPTGETTPYFNYILTRSDILAPGAIDQSRYRLIASDKASCYMAWERKKRVTEKPYRSVSLKAYRGSAEYTDLAVIDLKPEEKGKSLCLTLKGKGWRAYSNDHYQIGFKTVDSLGQQLRLSHIEQRWNHPAGTLNFDLLVRHIFVELQPNEAKMHVYLLNPEQHPIGIKPEKLEITEIIP